MTQGQRHTGQACIHIQRKKEGNIRQKKEVWRHEAACRTLPILAQWALEEGTVREAGKIDEARSESAMGSDIGFYTRSH